MKCPNCGGRDLREVTDDHEYGAEAIYVGFDCLDCGSELTATFELSEWDDA